MAIARPNPDGVKAALARNAAKHKRQATDLASRILAESNDPAAREIVAEWQKETGLSVRHAGPAPAGGGAEQKSGLDRLRGMSQDEIAAELRENPDGVFSALAGRPVTAGDASGDPTADDIRSMSAEQIVTLGPERALAIINREREAGR